MAISADVLSLIIFLICIVLFIIDKLPMATTAILGCLLMVITGVCSFSDAFSSFASSTVILTIGVMVIGASIAETGLAAAIGNWIVNVAKGSEVKLIIGTYLVSAAMSAFLTNSAVLAIFIPIIMGLSQANENIKARNLIMPIAYGCVIGGASTLVGSTQQMTAQGLLESAGLLTFSTFSFTPIGGAIVLIGLVYCLLIGRKRSEKIWGNRVVNSEDLDVDYSKSVPEKKNKTKMIIMAVIFIATVVFYITEWLPLAVTSTSAAVLCIITGCIKQKKAVSSVNWNIVGRLAGCLGIAEALEVAGGTELIAKAFSAIVGDSLSPVLLLFIMVLLTQITSEFISNSTALLIVLPIIISIAPEMGLNPYPYALAMTMASGIAVSCPLASSTLGMSMSAGYKFNDYFKYGIFLDIISYFVICISVATTMTLTV